MITKIEIPSTRQEYYKCQSFRLSLKKRLYFNVGWAERKRNKSLGGRHKYDESGDNDSGFGNADEGQKQIIIMDKIEDQNENQNKNCGEEYITADEETGDKCVSNRDNSHNN